MAARFNHTTVPATDDEKSAGFLAEILATPPPRRLGPFLQVRLDNDVTVDFRRTEDEIAEQHYAFLVEEAEFDGVVGRIGDRGLPYWADEELTLLGEVSDRPTGRGVHFLDPDGHRMEVVTRTA